MDLLGRWAQYFSALWPGLIVTLQVMIVASICTLLWGLVVALVRMSAFKPFRLLAIAYIEFFRGTPLLVQLLALYAALPVLTGIYLPAFGTALLALTANAGGYVAEAYRSGFEAVPTGQREAASALGMDAVLVFRRVVFPQAIRVILPAVGNTITSLLLTTPFVFLVGMADMMAKTNWVFNFHSDFSVYALATLIYATLAMILVAGNTLLERRLRLPGLSVGK